MLLRLLLVWGLFTAAALASEPTEKKAELHADGKSWDFYPAKEADDSLPCVLLIGDSIMNGYRGHVVAGMQGVANVDCWLTPMHLNSKELHKRLSEAASYRTYDVIHFNIGLHGWPEGRIPEGRYTKLMQKYVATLKHEAPEASLIWGSTTPVHEIDKQELNKEINPTIVHRNKLAAAVMDEEDVAVNDLYKLMEGHLHLVRGDRFHWKPQAYALMAKQTVQTIEATMAGDEESSDADGNT